MITMICTGLLTKVIADYVRIETRIMVVNVYFFDKIDLIAID